MKQSLILTLVAAVMIIASARFLRADPPEKIGADSIALINNALADAKVQATDERMGHVASCREGGDGCPSEQLANFDETSAGSRSAGSRRQQAGQIAASRFVRSDRDFKLPHQERVGTTQGISRTCRHSERSG